MSNDITLTSRLDFTNGDVTLDLNKKVEEIMEAQRVKAEAILAEVKANPDQFATIATKKSDDKVSGERGGELGFFSKADMVPEFSKAAFEMKPNTFSIMNIIGYTNSISIALMVKYMYMLYFIFEKSDSIISS